jgi:hypothetical protein
LTSGQRHRRSNLLNFDFKQCFGGRQILRIAEHAHVVRRYVVALLYHALCFRAACRDKRRFPTLCRAANRLENVALNKT